MEEEEEMDEVSQATARTDGNVMRAAAVAAFQPDHTKHILYFLLRLATHIQAGKAWGGAARL